MSNIQITARAANRGAAPFLIHILAIVLLSAALGSASEPREQDEVEKFKHLSIEELSQLEVTTPSKQPVQIFRTPAAVYVLTQDDIRRSGATSIPELLRLVPGVEVARIDGSKWSIGIRGFGSRLSRSVLVLIDGRTVYTTLFAGTYWEVQDTLIEDIDRIEVVRGPGGTIWGPNAVNGVINIITKDSRDTHGALVSAGGGNEEQGFVNFRYGDGNASGLNYRLYAKAFTRGPEFHPDHQDFDDWRAARTGFRLDWGTTDTQTYTLLGDLYTETAGQRVNIGIYTPPTETVVDKNADMSGGNVTFRWQRGNPSGGNTQLEAYYDRTNRHEPNLGELRDTFDIDLVHRLSARKRQQITWGLGARFSRGDFLEVISGLTFDPKERTDNLLSAFLQDEIELIEGRLSLTLGSKLLHTNFVPSEFEPSIRLMWTPTDDDAVWAAYTHAVRTPSRVERDFYLSSFISTAPDGTPLFARFSANRDFQSEQLNGYEIGYRHLLGKNFGADVATFYNHYHGLLSEEITGPISVETSLPFPESAPPPAHLLLPAQFGNGLMGETVGVELSTDWRPASFWRVGAWYAYLHIYLKKAPHGTDIGSAPIIAGSSPRHEAALESAIDIGKKFEFDQTVRYVSALAGQNVPAYTTGDLRFSWRPAERWEFSVVGRNPLQPNHAEMAGDPGPLVGIIRSVYAKVTWRR